MIMLTPPPQSRSAASDAGEAGGAEPAGERGAGAGHAADAVRGARPGEVGAHPGQHRPPAAAAADRGARQDAGKTMKFCGTQYSRRHLLDLSRFSLFKFSLKLLLSNLHKKFQKL